jgi:hypothetical protein
VVYTVDHAEAFVDTCTEKAVAYAASQLTWTWSTVYVAPRSTCSHCGSLNWLDHRVPALPSTAAVAGKAADSLDDAVTGRPCEMSGPAATAGVVWTRLTASAAANPNLSSDLTACSFARADALQAAGGTKKERKRESALPRQSVVIRVIYVKSLDFMAQRVRPFSPICF